LIDPIHEFSELSALLSTKKKKPVLVDDAPNAMNQMKIG
jgi:hypothetical protein